MQIQINGEYFPHVPINNALHVSDITTSGLFNNSVYSQNLLFNDISASRYASTGTFEIYDFSGSNFVDIAKASAPSYNRQAFLNENFVWIQPLCNGEGYVNKQLTGYDTEGSFVEVVVNHNAIVSGGSLFVGALTTECLTLSPATRR
jgi:hypothetical protein